MNECQRCGRLGAEPREDASGERRMLCVRCRPATSPVWAGYRRAWDDATRTASPIPGLDLDHDVPVEREERRSKSAQHVLTAIAARAGSDIADDVFGGRSLGRQLDDAIRREVRSAVRHGYEFYWSVAEDAGCGERIDTSGLEPDALEYFERFERRWSNAGFSEHPLAVRVACVFHASNRLDALAAEVPAVEALSEGDRLELKERLLKAMLGGYLLASEEHDGFAASEAA